MSAWKRTGVTRFGTGLYWNERTREIAMEVDGERLIALPPKSHNGYYLLINWAIALGFAPDEIDDAVVIRARQFLRNGRLAGESE